MKLVLGSLLLYLAFGPAHLFAQRATVNGTIVNEYGEPLSGVNVTIGELLFGTSTDENGQYSMAIPFRQVNDRALTLQVKAAGYVPVNRSVTLVRGVQTFDFLLESDLMMFDEPVLTGFLGESSRNALGFSVGQLDHEALLMAPASNPLASLQGRVAGVSVTKNTGSPGDGFAVRLRGTNSLTGDREPLFVVDGVILEDALVDLDALDIVEIGVLKGAAGAGHYGSRGANGVVQITTRRGYEQPLNRTRVTLRNEFGLQQLENTPAINQSHNLTVNGLGEFLDQAGEVVPYGEEAAIDQDINGASFYDNAFAGETFNTFDQFFDLGNTYSNFISISGNGARTNYHGSFTNLSEAGIVTGLSGYSRQSGRLNVDHRILRQLSMSASAFYATSSNDSPLLSSDAAPATARYNPFKGLLDVVPVSDFTGQDEDGTTHILADPLARVENPRYLAETLDLSTDRERLLGRFQVNVNPVDGLLLEAGISYDRSDRMQRATYVEGFKTVDDHAIKAGLREAWNAQSEGLNYDAAASFVQSFDGVTLRSRLQYRHEFFRDEAGYLPESTTLISSPTELSSVKKKVIGDSYFATLGLDLAGKFYVDGMLLREGNSLFGADERWQLYYRGSAAYRLSQEAWWPAWISEFKLRGAYGTAGRRPRFDAQYSTFGEVDGQLARVTLGNSILKPERSRELELGVEMAFSGRVHAEVVYAMRNTTDQLLLLPVSSLFGFQSQWQNVGEVASNTFEASLHATLIRTRYAELDFGIVFDQTRQTVESLPVDGFFGGPLNAFYFGAGESFGAMYGARFITDLSELPAGVDANAFDLNDNGYVVAVGTGNSFREGLEKQLWGTSVVTENGTYAWGMPIKDGKNGGKVKLGDALPDFNVGMPINFRYRGFRLGMLWYARIGGDIYNYQNQFSYRSGRSADQDQAGKTDALKKSAQYYNVLYDAGSINAHFVEDASYIRLREASLRYSFNSGQLSGLFGGLFHQMTFSLIGRNLVTFTDYSGFDPEAGAVFNLNGGVGTDASLYRVDVFGYPNYRSFTGMIEIQF